MARVIAEVGASGYICRMDCPLHANADLRCARARASGRARIARERPESDRESGLSVISLVRNAESVAAEEIVKSNSKQLAGTVVKRVNVA